MPTLYGSVENRKMHANRPNLREVSTTSGEHEALRQARSGTGGGACINVATKAVRTRIQGFLGSSEPRSCLGDSDLGGGWGV